jgi:hypothetical protein
MFTTDGLGARAVISSMAAITLDHAPVPSHPMTRYDRISASFATPAFSPAATPATRVPWPKQSVPPPSSSTKSLAMSARPPNSSCLARIPESMR